MEQKDYRLAAIMYTDIAGFSRMMERDEAGTLELLRYHNELFREIVEAHHGKIIKTIGDALLVDFKNTVEAMQSALEAQDKLYAHNKESPDSPLLVRIGIHLGDIYFFENDALGEGINIAARLQSLASPGCICFSQDVYNLVLNKIEFRAEKLGKVSLKNITKEIHAYEITTPNVEFDPNHDKPRPGYKPGSYLDGGEGGGEEKEEDIVGGMALSHAPLTPRPQNAAPSEAKPKPAEPPQPPIAPARSEGKSQAKPSTVDRSYSPEGSKQVLDEIRKAILQDIKNEGRRLSVQEALGRYGSFGVEAKEVIASMADSGLLVRRSSDQDQDSRSSFSFNGQEEKDSNQGEGNSPFGFNPELFGRNIEAAVHGIVGEIERSVERNMEREKSREYNEYYDRHRERNERRAERHAVREALRRDESELPTGKWDKKLRENDSWKPGMEERSETMANYASMLAERSRKQRRGFIGNLTSFIGVNAVVWYINIATTGLHGFLWAAIVTAAWGSGLLSSAVAARRGGQKEREAAAMPELEPPILEKYKKLNRVKDSIAMHGASTLGVPILLGLINYMTSSGFLWYLIPTAAILVSFILHLGSYASSKAKLQREIQDSLGVEGGWRQIFKKRKAQRVTSSELGAFAAQYEEAERSKAAILSEIKSGSPADSDIGPSLDSFVGQIRLLAQSANEIDRIVGAIPMNDLESDKAALLAKASRAQWLKASKTSTAARSKRSKSRKNPMRSSRIKAKSSSYASPPRSISSNRCG